MAASCAALVGTAVTIGTHTPGAAAVSLDGSNCIIFGGQVKRELAVCVAWEGEGHTLSISLVGRAPNRIARVVLRRDGAEPFQTLHLNVQPPINSASVGLLYTDMNFDGHGDLGIMRREHTAVRQPFVYFLYDVHTRRFKRALVLETLGHVSFEEKARRVTHRWRDKGHQYKDGYSWAGESLRLSEREKRTSTPPICELITYVWEHKQRVEHARKPCP